jgi:cobalt-precorrin-6B (C15)-methyltransferase
MWKYRTPGIPDEFFQRAEEIPMTKEEVRTLTISKARLKTRDIVIEIGCGTGSLTVEASIQVSPGGKVYAIDREKKAIDLTRQNLDQFGFRDTVQLVHGEASVVLGDLPAADAILIGSGGDHLAKIINLASLKLKPEGRIVINAILLETIYAATKELAKAGFKDIEATQISVAKGRWTQKGTMMISRNPIMIISATK